MPLLAVELDQAECCFPDDLVPPLAFGHGRWVAGDDEGQGWWMAVKRERLGWDGRQRGCATRCAACRRIEPRRAAALLDAMSLQVAPPPI